MTIDKDLIVNRDVLGQEIPPVFMKAEEVSKKANTIDYSKVYILPSLRTRYTSMLIDAMVIVLLGLLITKVFEVIGNVSDWIRAFSFILVFILYEPILVSLGSTIGQYLLNIRVRKFDNPVKKLPFHLVFIRLIVKGFLGWISFITVTLNINRRAIHDLASGSIMISSKKDDQQLSN
jgi:uncharacterized RDD family membrane protein YckC